MLLPEHKNANMFKTKRLIEKGGGVPATSTRCSDHLGRQFLITASTFPYSSKNSLAEHIHAFYTCLCEHERERKREERERECVCVCVYVYVCVVVGE